MSGKTPVFRIYLFQVVHFGGAFQYRGSLWTRGWRNLPTQNDHSFAFKCTTAFAVYMPTVIFRDYCNHLHLCTTLYATCVIRQTVSEVVEIV